MGETLPPYSKEGLTNSAIPLKRLQKNREEKTTGDRAVEVCLHMDSDPGLPQLPALHEAFPAQIGVPKGPGWTESLAILSPRLLDSAAQTATQFSRDPRHQSGEEKYTACFAQLAYCVPALSNERRLHRYPLCLITVGQRASFGVANRLAPLE